MFSLLGWAQDSESASVPSNLRANVRPLLAKPYVLVPIQIDETAQSEAWVFPREERKDFAIEAQALLSSLNAYLPVEMIAKLRLKITPEGTVSLADLDGLGLTTQFKEDSLVLDIRIPINIRKRYRLNFNFGEPEVSQIVRPSAHSGYLNYRINKSFEYGPMPLSGRIDFAENVNGYVLESSADFIESDQYPWRRQDTRLRKDDEVNMLRYTLGDLTVPGRGFQLAPSMAGLGVAREFSIQPYRTARPLGNQEIQIKRPSIVELYINGAMYSQVRLLPGNFNIRDFPLAAGQNNIQIKIRDDLGQEEVFDFSMLFENTILNQGTHEFSYNVGMPWVASGADRTYEEQNKMVSLFHRYGFTNQFTAGLNFQNYLNQSLFGVELSQMTSLGYFSADIASSDSPNQSGGAAGRLRYRSLDRMFGKETRTVLTLEAEKRNKEFIPVDAVSIFPPLLDTRLDAQISYRFDGGIIFGVGAGSQKSFVSASDNNQYRSNLILPFTPWTRMEFSYIKNTNEQKDDQGYISFYWSEREGLKSVSAYHDTQTKGTTVNFARSNRKNYDDYRIWGSAQNTDDYNSANLSGEYLTQKGSLRLDQFSSRQNDYSRSVTTLGVSSAIAWVGSEWSMSQPINDSFALVSVPEKSAQKYTLAVNPFNNYNEATVEDGHTTVLPNHTSYYIYQVNLDATSLPMGTLLDKEYYNVQPSYRSGILISAVINQKVMIKGRLMGSNSEALAYAAGDVYNDKNQLVDNTFFTSKDGKFYVEGLEPGSYRVEFEQNGLKEISFIVDKNIEGGMLDLGDVKLHEVKHDTN